MQVPNPMNLTNLLNSLPAKQENSSTILSRRTSHDSTHFTLPLAYRPANSHGPCAPPSPPASDYSPGLPHQQLTLPQPSPSYIPATNQMPRCDLAVRPTGHSSLPSPYNPHASFQQQLPPMQVAESDAMIYQRMIPHQYQDLYDCRFQRSPESPMFTHQSRPRSGSYTDGRPSSMYDPYMMRVNKPLKNNKKRSSPSNVKYTREQVDFIRYFKEDLGKRWTDIVDLFAQQFPGEQRQTPQCLTSRSYRDNQLPFLDEQWNLTFEDDEGPGQYGPRKVRLHPAKVRDRTAPCFKDAPYKLIEKHPERALQHIWVSEEHKEKARLLLEEDKRGERLGRVTNTAMWRKRIKEADAYNKDPR